MAEKNNFPYSELVPLVQSIEAGDSVFDFSAGGSWSCDRSSICQERIEELFSSDKGSWNFSPASGMIRFEIIENVPGQSYELLIKKDSVVIRGGDDAALYYGALTFFQLVDICGCRIPCSLIKDAPALSVRGVMLDVSRDKVPSMQTLLELIDKLARLKFNHLQFYMEHAFAYKAHESVWHDASSLTADEVLQLDEYCRNRFIELVPNQNSFGHMERWLTRPEYNHLAAMPEGGAPLPWGGLQSDPTALNPLDPHCLEFLDGLYSELLPCFSSNLFNIGGDEVFELSAGRCADEVKKRGEGPVYLEFLKKIFGVVRKYGSRPAFWGDIIVKYPELVSELPADVIALEWGYEADHPFEEHSRLFKDAGLDFYVCPGTSAWNSISGRFGNMRENILSAARNGLKSCAKGLVVTDWGDAGHWQPLCVSYAGFAYAAAASWNPDNADEINAADAVNRFFVDGCVDFGETLIELASLYKTAGALCSNSSVLFHLFFKKDYSIPDGVTIETLDAVQGRLDLISERLENLSIEESGEPRSVYQEIVQMIRLLAAAVLRGKALITGVEDTPEFKKDWNLIMDECLIEQRNIWMQRNRVGGLADSLEHAMRYK